MAEPDGRLNRREKMTLSDAKEAELRRKAKKKGDDDPEGVNPTSGEKVDEQAESTKNRLNAERAGLANDPVFDKPVRDKINDQLTKRRKLYDNPRSQED